IENRTYISGDGVAQNLGADRTSRDYRKHLWQRVFAFGELQRDLECVLIEPNHLASRIKRMSDARTIAKAQLEILGGKSERVDDRALFRDRRMLWIGSQSA